MAKGICSTEGCDREVVARGMCMKCYQRWRGGRPLALPESLTCPVCSKEFQPHHSQQKYCSAECKSRKRPPKVYACDYCGKEFTRPAGRGKILYCSPECAKVAVSIRSHVRDYGMTKTQYREMLEAQGGVCAICGKAEALQFKKVLSVDHDHDTGQIRGLLCHTCNVGLGHFKDDPDLIRTAIEYIERHRKPPLNVAERAVWAEWNALSDDEPSPVKRIAQRLLLEPADVAFIVYPAEQFGRWDDDQEPDLMT